MAEDLKPQTAETGKVLMMEAVVVGEAAAESMTHEIDPNDDWNDCCCCCRTIAAAAAERRRRSSAALYSHHHHCSTATGTASSVGCSTAVAAEENNHYRPNRIHSKQNTKTYLISTSSAVVVGVSIASSTTCLISSSSSSAHLTLGPIKAQTGNVRQDNLLLAFCPTAISGQIRGEQVLLVVLRRLLKVLRQQVQVVLVAHAVARSVTGPEFTAERKKRKDDKLIKNKPKHSTSYQVWSLEPEVRMCPSGCQFSDQTIDSWACSIAPTSRSDLNKNKQKLSKQNKNPQTFLSHTQPAKS